ncbi:hypothetical protein Vafri_10630 [Volvox africanus]|uniref:Uncharacterized protein n=1 Tax=Volvox africanus TaxID=51714 RepID=A0A8J4B633_9CHLO|nr:hypothetical protein Vafri_10630 [Volvox africanus]
MRVVHRVHGNAADAGTPATLTSLSRFSQVDKVLQVVANQAYRGTAVQGDQPNLRCMQITGQQCSEIRQGKGRQVPGTLVTTRQLHNSIMFLLALDDSASGCRPCHSCSTTGFELQGVDGHADGDIPQRQLVARLHRGPRARHHHFPGLKLRWGQMVTQER